MTKDDAIFAVEYYKLHFASNKNAIKAFDMAISALENEPSISEDGTLTVNVEDSSKVGRVLVSGDNHFGRLYYPDQEPCDKCVYSTSEGCQYDDITETIPPFDDCISRQAVLDGLANIAKAKARSDAQKALMGRVMFFTEKLPPVNPQKPKSEWQQDHEILKAYSDGANAVLDEIKADIEQECKVESDHPYGQGLSRALEIIDRYKAEGVVNE